MNRHSVMPVGNTTRTFALLRLLSAILDRYTLALNILGSVLIVCVMVLVNVDVVGRNLLDQPVSGVPELVTMSVVVIVFLQVAHAFRWMRLTRSLVLLDFVKKRSARVRAMLELLLCIGAGAIAAQLLGASWPLFLKAWVSNTYEGTIGSFTVAVWPVKLIIVVGCSALLGQILIRALFSMHAFWFDLPLPDSDTDDQP